MAQRLRQKVAIITGGGSRLGAAVAHVFAREGARVVVCDASPAAVARVVEQINDAGGQAISYCGDVSQKVHAQACVQSAIDNFHRLDVLINQASALIAIAETQDFALEAFDRTTQLNLRSTFLMTKFALPHLQATGGNIISSGSESGNSALAQSASFGAARAWIHAFMRGVAAEQAPHGVRANCVCPEPLDGAGIHLEDPGLQPQLDQIAGQSDRRRRSTPEEIAGVYAFLASDMASYVTGALWTVDGNITISAAAIAGDNDAEEPYRWPPPEKEIPEEERGGLPPPEEPIN